MKTCGLVLMVLGLLLIQQGQAVSNQGVTHVTNHLHCNCDKSSKLLIALMRSVLSRCVKIPPTDGGLPHGCPTVPKNCDEVLKCDGKQSGVYTIDPDGKGAFKVYCDQKTTVGGWTVFQKRLDGSENFYRGWNDYKKGFGDLKGEFWLGLDKINRLTKQVRNRLRVDLEDTTGKTVYAEYDPFAVSSEQNKYKLSLGNYSGTAGDSLSSHRGFPFTTIDNDNDKSKSNCAKDFKGAWWYSACHSSNLNGIYHHGKHKSYADGVNWSSWKGQYYSAKRAEMKIRPA